MNLSPELIRLWLLATAIWIVCACAMAVENVRSAIQENYHYVAALRDGRPGQQDGSRPFYELNKPPNKAGPLVFASVGNRTLADFDEHVKAGRQTRASFPDGSWLYLDASLTRPDRDLLAHGFWEQRWSRWWSVSWKWIAGAFLPPVLLLALASSLAWALKGFQR